MLTNVCSKGFRYGLVHGRHKLPLFAALACMLWVAPLLAQNNTTPTQAGADNSASKSETASKLPPEPARPDWLPKDAVWTGKGWNAPLSLWDLYGILFDESIRNDEAAAESEKRGEGGSRCRDSLTKALSLTEAQAQDLREAALSSREQTDAIDKSMDVIAKAYRATIPKDAPPFGPERWKVVPPPPKELDQLQQQRQDTIMRVAETLKQNLGSEAAARLDKYLEAKGGVATVGYGPLPPEVVKKLEEIKRRTEQKTQQQESQQVQK